MATIGALYSLGVIVLLCLLWVVDYQNLHWKKNLKWAVLWPVWIPLWLLSMFVAVLALWVFSV